jgi:fibro-slime domain-containing protein/uncharacterized repeat protein (TIGR02543 family)
MKRSVARFAVFILTISMIFTVFTGMGYAVAETEGGTVYNITIPSKYLETDKDSKDAEGIKDDSTSKGSIIQVQTFSMPAPETFPAEDEDIELDMILHYTEDTLDLADTLVSDTTPLRLTSAIEFYKGEVEQVIDIDSAGIIIDWYINGDYGGSGTAYEFIPTKNGVFDIYYVASGGFLGNREDIEYRAQAITITVDRGLFVDIENNTVTRGIKLNLFNYGNKINNYADVSGFGFFDWIPANNNGYYTIDNAANKGKVAGRTGLGQGAQNGLVQRLLGADGYPVTYRDYSMGFLFDPSSTTDAKTYSSRYTNTGNYERYYLPVEEYRNGLLQKDAQGYYYYDTLQNSAFYNEGRQKFVLYDYLVHPWGAQDPNGALSYELEAANFAPFTKMVSGVNLFKEGGNGYVNGKPSFYTMSKSDISSKGIAGKNYLIDMWFGLSMEFDFVQPYGGKINGDDMIFEYEGDDDLYVFVDGVLVADLGGTHGGESVSINFASGAVEYDSRDDTTIADQFTAAGVEGDFTENIFSDGTKHTLKLFYIERGGSYQHLKLRFNIPQEEYSLRVGLDNVLPNNGSTVKPTDVEYEFKLEYVNEGDGGLKAGKNMPYTVYNENGNKVGEGTTDDRGHFKIRDKHNVIFGDLKIGDTYKVTELNIDAINFWQVNITGDTIYDRYKSRYIGDPLFDKAQKTTGGYVIEGGKYLYDVLFENFYTSGTGELLIEVKPKDTIDADNEFLLEVEIGGELFAGEYNVYTDGKTTEPEIREATNGRITLKPGEIAVIDGIIEGTSVSIDAIVDEEIYVSSEYDVEIFSVAYAIDEPHDDSYYEDEGNMDAVDLSYITIADGISLLYDEDTYSDGVASEAGYSTAFSFQEHYNPGNTAYYTAFTFERVKYKLLFDENGGDELSPDYKEVAYGDEYGDLPVPTWEGHTFLGWFADEEGGDKVTSETMFNDKEDITIYAHWEVTPEEPVIPIVYTVTFDGNGGVVAPENETRTVAPNESLGDTMPTVAPTHTGNYMFVGWYTAGDTSGTEFTKDTLVTGNITVYAHWTYVGPTHSSPSYTDPQPAPKEPVVEEPPVEDPPAEKEEPQIERPPTPEPPNHQGSYRTETQPDGSIIFYNDEGTPLGTYTWDNETSTWIWEAYVPLEALPDKLPQTGAVLDDQCGSTSPIEGTIFALTFLLFLLATVTSVWIRREI